MKVTAAQIRSRKASSDAPKIVAITAYDYSMARVFDELVDIVLVGDSLGMVVQGKANTLEVSLEEMIYHSSAVRRGARLAHLVADMPWMTFQVSPREALRNAGQLLGRGGAEAVKLEGGVAIADTVKALVQVGIPVMGHVGLTPQKVHQFGGFKVQGKTPQSKETILKDALALQEAGVYAMVLEGVPGDLAREITDRVSVPTIGIGAGPGCDGQVLVSQDLLGLNLDFKPKFVKRYADVAGTIRSAVAEYANEVRSGSFPDEAHSFQ